MRNSVSDLASVLAPLITAGALLTACATTGPQPEAEAIFVPTQILAEAPEKKLPAVPPLPELAFDIKVLAFNILPRERPVETITLAEAPIDILEGINLGGVGGPEVPLPVKAPKLSVRPRVKPARSVDEPVKELAPPPSLRRI